MKCPRCGENTPDAWQVLGTAGIASGSPPGRSGYLTISQMYCASEACQEARDQLVVRIEQFDIDFAGGVPLQRKAFDGIVYPRVGVRQVPTEVPEPFRRDYEEAGLILDLSPRMSAVLSRRVLYDLLEKYVGIAEYTLKGSIDAFVADTSHPQRVRENLHYLREIGDFGAHTQTDKGDQAEILDIGPEEAAWTLTVIDDLFDYFIVSPARSSKMREQMDARLEAAGRSPIQPLADEEPRDTDA